MRLFVSINLNDEMLDALEDLQDGMYDAGVRGRFTPAENLHLTLAFIGEYPDPDAVLGVLQELDFDPFPIRLEGVGAFGDLWWAGLAKSAPLEALVRRLRRALSDAGIPFDKKKFRPHLTLIRRAESPDGKIPAGLLVGEVGEPAGMLVDHISLMRSERGKHGMIYTEL